jgi:UDP-sulfoquinovose synthase
MKVLVTGADGYLGWPTCLRFSARGDEVLAVDSYAKRAWEDEVGVRPLVPVPSLEERVQRWFQVSGRTIGVQVGDLCEEGFIERVITRFTPDVVIHFGQQPSAPYSMLDARHAIFTQTNNVVGTLRLLFALRDHSAGSHLIKLGTMGEYGTPGIDIEEGFLDIEHRGRRDRLPFPKQPGSIYHLSKVHDSHNIMFACRTWRLRASDLNQGIVYGLDTGQTQLHPELRTSFHYDAIFGTVLNRFCVQALTEHPLTVYGRGRQTRGFLNILDTLQSIEAVADNPPAAGEYRVFNQFTEQFVVAELAQRVAAAASAFGRSPSICSTANPRVEAEEHYYRAVHTGLADLGVRPHLLDDDILASLLAALEPAVSRIDRDAFWPTIYWTGEEPESSRTATRMAESKSRG